VIAVRYVLPAVVVIGGLVVMLLGSDNDLEGGAGIVSAGLAILFINWLFRVGVAGESERSAEEQAREYFDRHGYWPDEAPPAGEPATGARSAGARGRGDAATGESPSVARAPGDRSAGEPPSAERPPGSRPPGSHPRRSGGRPRRPRRR
jgi:hypothetical protein